MRPMHRTTRGSGADRARRPSLSRGRVELAAVMLGGVMLAGCAAPSAGSGAAPQQIFANPTVAELAGAAAAGNTGLVHKLARDGVDLDARGDRDVTPLEWALLHRNPHGFQALLDAGADPEESAIGGDPVILMASEANDVSYLKILLAHGVDPSAVRGRSGQTPLMAACGPDTGRQFQILLAAGADPNRTDRLGENVLFAPCTYAQTLQLLNAGADPRVTNRVGYTFQTLLNITPNRVLTSQARRQRDQIYLWLREHGVPIHGKPPT